VEIISASALTSQFSSIDLIMRNSTLSRSKCLICIYHLCTNAFTHES